MNLRTIAIFGAMAAALAACGDDSGDGAGGSGSGGGSVSSTGTGATTGATTGSTTSATTTATTGATTGATTSATTTTTSTGGTEYDCDTYCTTIQAACDGAQQQYPDNASCLAACAGFPEGEFQDSDNSLGCRYYHATVASSDPVTHCGHAGPLGGDQCGTPCEGFCAAATTVCTGDNEIYASVDACMKVCEGYEPGEYSQGATGDNLGCRMYHLSVAATNSDNAVIHCPHAGFDSDQCL